MGGRTGAMRKLTANEIKEYEALTADSRQLSLTEDFGIGGAERIEHGNRNQIKEEKEDLHYQRQC